jgi:tetratricopeptide (TPR) repeat protein
MRLASNSLRPSALRALLVAAGLCWGGATLGAAPALAEEAAAPDQELKAAKESFEAAQASFVREEYEKAADQFLNAFEHKPFSAFLFNAAVAFEKAKRLDQAKEYFERYLAIDPGASDAAQVKARIDALTKVLTPAPPPATPPPSAPGAPATPPTGATPPGSPAPPGGAPPTPPSSGPLAPGLMAPESLALPAFLTKGLVVIDSKPQGATIYLNDKKSGPFGKTPWQGSLEPKAVRIILESKGYKPEERAVTPQSDKLVDIYIALSEEHYLGWIEVTSNAVGAQVFIDRKDIGAIGRTPFTGHLKPGKHTIYIEKQGWGGIERSIEVKPGTATQYNWPLEKSNSGWLNVTGKEALGAHVVVDKKLACVAPCRAEVLPGKRKIVVEKEGMEDYESELDVGRTTETTIDVQFSPRPPKTRAISTGVAALVVLGAGAFVGNLSKNNEGSIKADIKAGVPVDNTDSRFLRGKLEAIGADVLYGFGALFAVSFVVTLLSHGPDSTGTVETKSLGLAPTVGPDAGGLAAFGRF